MEQDNRFISSTKNLSDSEVENKLRPTTFDEYVGQEKIKNNLNRDHCDTFFCRKLSFNQCFRSR